MLFEDKDKDQDDDKDKDKDNDQDMGKDEDKDKDNDKDKDYDEDKDRDKNKDKGTLIDPIADADSATVPFDLAYIHIACFSMFVAHCVVLVVWWVGRWVGRQVGRWVGRRVEQGALSLGFVGRSAVHADHALTQIASDMCEGPSYMDGANLVQICH